jgi:hypothetical protein
MEIRFHSRGRMLGTLAILPLVAAACGSGGNTASNASSGTSSTSSMHSGGAQSMMMQPGAENMKVDITSPADGAMVTANTVALQVTTAGYDDTCDLAGKEPQQGMGHYHVEIDKQLVNMYCTPQATVSMQNLKPGKHTLTVLPAQNDHADIEMNARSITIDYEPATPLPTLTDATFPGAPAIKILSPQPGTVLSGPFDVTVEITNFNPSCDLYGKPDLAGYGHWHLNVDSSTGPMMGMGTMLGMSCDKVFHATSVGMTPGTHTLIALLVDNGHAPLHPAVEDKVQVTIK